MNKQITRRNCSRSMQAVCIVAMGLMLNGCGPTKPPEMSPGHISGRDTVPADAKGQAIPPVVTQAPVLSMPKPAPKLETYTVVVADVPVKELLFSLARDASLNVDIAADVSGSVTMNAVDQTLPQVLERLSRQVSLRYTIDGDNLLVSADTPFWHIYRVDYVNMSRESTSEVKVATQIATTGGSNGSGGGDGNVSNTTVKNVSNNPFWATLQANISAIIGDDEEKSDLVSTPPPAATATAVDSPATGAANSGAVVGASQTAVAVISAAPKASIINKPVVANPGSGLINVYATQQQHEQVQSFLDRVMVNAQRQVLIEMTIVEVELSDGYQMGVDWSRLSNSNGTAGNGPSLISNLIGSTNLSTAPVFSIGYQNANSSIGNITATIKMLESFGNVRVLSSPKIMALNNQTALLKVVDETVYFTVEQETTQVLNQPSITTYTSEVHTVPVGMVMSVIPQINENNNVTMNIRPTISRITSFKEDPVPKLVGANFENLVPQIQVRELESLLQVGDGQTIVMGGLMQNKLNKAKDGIPFLQNAPVIGDLFSYRNDLVTKTELVIFLRPTVIRSADMQTKWQDYKHLLPQNYSDNSPAMNTEATSNSQDQSPLMASPSVGTK
jgi:general secretion pathway protein D